ncbi:hypothetical protein D1AOALGA4SA_1060 [Olavius algarvensis Delta 1 endosymbiont]|nr:hypothetical protein D1AOALGA4SA_1060 [Olavius algarvensis Delta 1 endosymbiont]
MNITCPNCQKNYTINEARLPAGIKSAKCKACGNLIPLKGPKLESRSKPIQMVNLTCQYCGQSHDLQLDKIPPMAKNITCRSCSRPVPLSRAQSPGPIRSPEKESPPSPPPETAAKPAVPPAGADSDFQFTCAGCGKQYKISRDKITPNVMAIKCKACGHKFSLPREDDPSKGSGSPRPAAQQAQAILPKSAPMSKTAPLPVSRPRAKKRLFAAAACVVLVGILGALVHFNIVKVDWLRQYIPGTAQKTTESLQSLNQEPFLVLNLNVPLILDAIESDLEPDKKTARLMVMMPLIKAMDLRQLELYLYPASDSRVLPVIMAHGGSRQQWKDVFNSEKSFQEYFTRESDDTYRLKPEAIGDAQKYDLPPEPYQLTLVENGALLAPVSFSAALQKTPDSLSNAPVVKFAHSIAKRQDLVAVGIRLPKNFIQGWEKKIQDHPAAQINPQTAMIAGMGTRIISQLSGSLKPVDILALGFRFAGQNGRALSYAQQFRPEVDGEKIYRQLAAADATGAEINGIIKNLIELFKDQRYQHTLDYKNNRLSLEFSWSKTEDEAFLTALTAATIGQLFAASMELTPTPGAVTTRYAAEPDVVAAVDSDQLRAEIPALIKNSLFPGYYWNQGDQPQMTLDLDTIDIPNGMLAEMTYEVKSVESPDGRDIRRVDENKFKPRIQPGSLIPGNISLSVKAETPPEDLAKAVMNFHLTVPVALEVLEFSEADQPGSVKVADGVRVTLGRLEKDVAQVSSSGGKSMRLIAYDQTGKALASRESMSTQSSIATRFDGIITRLKVVVTRKMLDYPFDIEVDLNQGKKLALSRKPEVPARKRYNHHPIPSYVNFGPDDLENLAVAWSEGKEGSWNDSLSIKLPQGPFSGHAAWEVHFFGYKKPRLLSGNSAHGQMDFSFTLNKDQLKQANAAFGKVQLNLHTDISRLVFAPQNQSQPAPQALPSGDTIMVKFNKNEITYSIGNADVIQTLAYDGQGKRLMQDQYTRNKDGKRVIYFWGVPAKFEMDVSTKTLKKLIAFDLRQRPLDEKAYQAFKLSIKNQRDVVKTIKTIDRARRKMRSYYGDDLAGLHYLYQHKQKKPMNLVSREIAHSDPAGQERFGYQAKPYKGYYFTVLSGIESNGTHKNYNRRSQVTRFSWQKGTISTSTLTRHPDLVAIPQDKSQPTFFLQWGQVFMKSLNGKKLEYLPDGYYNKGWVEARYVDK